MTDTHTALEEAKWKQSEDLSGVKWPLAGYAPGNYIGTCRSCNKQMHGCDKRACQCLSCAINELREGYEQLKSVQPVKPRELLEAIGEMSLAIKPHYMDTDQRGRISTALSTLVDHIIAVAALKAKEAGDV